MVTCTLETMELDELMKLSAEGQNFRIQAKKLDLSETSELRAVPKLIAQVFPDLEELNLTNCKEIKTLPESIGQLKSLKILRLEGCNEEALKGFEATAKTL